MNYICRVRLVRQYGNCFVQPLGDSRPKLQLGLGTSLFRARFTSFYINSFLLLFLFFFILTVPIRKC